MVDATMRKAPAGRTVARALACVGLAAAVVLAAGAERREHGPRATSPLARPAVTFPVAAGESPEGLALVLPCTDHFETTHRQPDGRIVVHVHSLGCDIALLPQQLDISAELEAEPGAGATSVYRLRLEVEGMFSAPPAPPPPGARRTWGVPRLALATGAGIGLRSEPRLEWNGTRVRFEPVMGASQRPRALHAEVPFDPLGGGRAWFTLSLELVRIVERGRPPSARMVQAGLRAPAAHAACIDDVP